MVAMVENVTQAEVNAVIRDRIDEALRLARAAEQAGAVFERGAVDAMVHGAVDEAESIIQSRPGGWDAWRDYWNMQNEGPRRVHNEIARGRMPVGDRPRTQYEMQFDDSGAYVGLRPVDTGGDVDDRP